MTTPARQIRAEYDAETITVYQAYSPEIALPAVRAGRFVPPFRMGRMTWIKPSFLWMMYRSGWAGKPGQEHVLAVRLRREGFERALSMACLSSFDPAVHGEHAAWRREKERCPVRVQWDPERSPDLQPLPWRAIQIGLSGPAVQEYVQEWTLEIRDLTERVRRLHAMRPLDPAQLPNERPYPVSGEIMRRLGMDAGPAEGAERPEA